MQKKKIILEINFYFNNDFNIKKIYFYLFKIKVEEMIFIFVIKLTQIPEVVLI